MHNLFPSILNTNQLCKIIRKLCMQPFLLMIQAILFIQTDIAETNKQAMFQGNWKLQSVVPVYRPTPEHFSV